MEVIGLLGAGVMGRTIAPRILTAGHTLLAYDPSAEAQDKIKSIGATLAPDVVTIAKRANMIIMFLPGPRHVQACVAGPEGLLSAAKPGAVIVDMSTVDPATSRRMAELARQGGVGYLDAPVLGRPAAVGTWALPIGGTPKEIERCTPILKLFAAKLFHVGGPGSGNKVKLLNQLMFSAINAMTAEMMAVAEKVGISPQFLFETIMASQAGTVSNLFKELGTRIAKDDYQDPTFSIDLLCKDVRLAIEMAKEANAPPLLAGTIQFANEVAQAQGFGQKDTAIMWKMFGKLWEGGA